MGSIENEMNKYKTWELTMHVSYKKLWIMLIKKNMSKSELRKKARLSAGVFTRLNKNEDVSLSALKSICEILECDIGQICSFTDNSEGEENNV